MSLRALPTKPAVLAYLSLALAALYIPFASWGYFAHYGKELTDYHLISLGVENAKRFEAFGGAYSRLGFRHPGPFLFYWYALWENLIPLRVSPQAKYALSQFILNILLLAAIIHTSARNFSFRALQLLWLPLLLILLGGRGGTALGTLSDVWNPYATPIPTLLLLVSAAAIAIGDGLGILYLAFAAVVMCHAHLGAVPIAGAVSLGALAVLAKKLWDGNPPRNWGFFLASAAAFTAATSVPVIYDAFIRPEWGNIGKIISFSKNASAQMPLASAYKLFAPHVSKPFRFAVGSGIGSGIFLGLALIVIWLPGIADRGYRHLRAFATLALMAALYSTMRIQGHIFGYLLLYQFGIAALLLALLIWRVCDFCLNYRQSAPREIYRITAILFIALALSPIWLKGKRLKAPRYLRNMDVHRQFAEALPDPKANYFRFSLADNSIWPFAGELAYLMKKLDYKFCFPENWSFVFDYSQSCSFQDALSKNKALAPVDVVLKIIPDKAYRKTADSIIYHGSSMSWKVSPLAEKEAGK